MRKSYNDSGLTAKRSYRLLTAGLTAILMAVSLALQAQDYFRLGERTINGTARYVGMSGAMSAIGGDPSSAHDNPAGLGLYRRSEVTLSFDQALDYTWQPDAYKDRYNANIFSVPQASIVFSLPQNNKFQFSYRRLQSYRRTMYGVGKSDYSLGAILNTLDVNWDISFCTGTPNRAHDLKLAEAGMVHEYAFNWAINISDSWYVGAGLQVQSYNLSADAIYQEDFAGGMYNSNKTTLFYSGVSTSLSAGLIYRPFEWLRLGVGLQTPSLGAMSISSTGELASMTDSLRFSYAPDQTYTERSVITQPLHLSSSVAFQIGAYGMVALQHDYYHQPKETDRHSLRAGIEVIPVLGFYINAGYACESTFKQDRVVAIDPTFNRQDTYFQMPQIAHYGSLALGYRGKYMMAQVAYQYRRQQLNLYAHEFAAPYNLCADTHRIVFTIGWHRY